MSKFVKGLLEFITFIVLYLIYYYIGSKIIIFLIQLIASIPIIGRFIFSGYLGESIIYAVVPIFCGLFIAFALVYIFKKLEIASVIAMYIVLSAIYLPSILMVFSYYGMSWDFINNAGAMILFCAAFAITTFMSTGYRLQKDDSEE